MPDHAPLDASDPPPPDVETVLLPCGEALLQQPLSGGLAWLGSEIDPDACVIALDAMAKTEVLALAEQMAASPLPLLQRRPDQFDLPALTAVMTEAERRLDEGPGIAVIDRLPLDELDQFQAEASATAKAVFWVLGQMLGPPVAQKWDGTRIYDVTDTGARYEYGVRGSWTNVELVFHTDNAFALAPPERVGLLCLAPAAEGGESRFCSLYSLHNRLLERFPDQLRRLYRPVLWDRQGEHAPGAPKTAWGPVFSYDGARLSARANVSLIRKGYGVAGLEPDAETQEALAVLAEVAEESDLWFELPIERGQLQYLNNQEIAHFRGTFRDHADPARKRHLIRTWHRGWGGPAYDG